MARRIKNTTLDQTKYSEIASLSQARGRQAQHIFRHSNGPSFKMAYVKTQSVI